MKQQGQFEKVWLRWIAVTGIVLVLLFSGLEAVHAHPHSRMANGSSGCTVCVTLHSNAAAPIFHALPALRAVALVLAVPQTSCHGTGVEISLFTRPPPATA